MYVWVSVETRLTKSCKKFISSGCNLVWHFSALMNYPWLFCPSENLEHCFALPTRSSASVRAFLYLYWLYDPRRWEINRKVRAPRHVSASGVPNIVTWIKQTWMKHQCTKMLFADSWLSSLSFVVDDPGRQEQHVPFFAWEGCIFLKHIILGDSYLYPITTHLQAPPITA